MANDYALSISNYGNVIIDVYHVPIYDANLLSLPQLTSCIYVWLNNVAPLPMLDVMPIMITNWLTTFQKCIGHAMSYSNLIKFDHLMAFKVLKTHLH